MGLLGFLGIVVLVGLVAWLPSLLATRAPANPPEGILILNFLAFILFIPFPTLAIVLWLFLLAWSLLSD